MVYCNPLNLGCCARDIFYFVSISMVATEQFAKATSDAATAGTAMGAGVSYAISIFIGATSLVAGLVGWLLLSSRKVYRCIRCSFILERA